MGDITEMKSSPLTSFSPRTKLPSPMIPRDQISIWSILKNCIGKELYKITMPVAFNEPLTMLQRACEGIQYADLLDKADLSDDPSERLEYICAHIVAGLSSNCHRIIKPFNPLLYETYEMHHMSESGSITRSIAQQVSHHPPITAAMAESNHFITCGSVNPKIKFWGRTIEVLPDGQCQIYLKRHKENYVFKSVSCVLHNIIVGNLWFEHVGPLIITCVETGFQANLNFKSSGWFHNDLHRFDGIISSFGENKERIQHRYIYGKWSNYVMSVDYDEYEKFIKNTLRNKPYRIPDDIGHSNQNVNGISHKLEDLNLDAQVEFSQSVESSNKKKNNNNNQEQSDTRSQSSSNKRDSSRGLFIPNSRNLWRLRAVYLKEYYNFTPYTLRMNQLTDDLRQSLPRTDSRFRPDVRRLEEGDLDGAAREKERLEEKQRAARARDSRFKDPSADFLFFEHTNVPYSDEKFWVYKGGYWENKCKPDMFPDLF